MPFTNQAKAATEWDTTAATVPPAAFGTARFGESRFGDGSVAATADLTNQAKTSTTFTNQSKSS